MKKNKIALIDGYGFVFRAYHSLPPLTRSDGTPVGAVYGFTNMLIRLLASLEATHIAIVFDSGSKTFRNEIYDKYKANRPPCPEDLIPQFPLIREVAESLNLYILEKVGYEADDLIATVAKGVDKDKFDVVVISSDKDLMQLVGDNIIMFDAMKNRTIGPKEVEEKFFVTPDKVLDVLSLMGDASDNIPGVRGIGPKIAAELINQYGTLENLLKNAHEIKQNKRRESLQEGVEIAMLSKQLITLCETVPIDMNMKDYEIKNVDPFKLMDFLQEQGFSALRARIQKEFGIASKDMSNQKADEGKQQEVKKAQFAEVKKIHIKSLEEIEKINQQALINGYLVLDVELDSLDKNIAKSITISTAAAEEVIKEVYHISLANNSSSQTPVITDLFAVTEKEDDDIDPDALPVDKVASALHVTLDNPAIVKIGYKVKEFIKFFSIHNVNLSPIDDIAVMAYIVDSGSDKSNIRNLIDINLLDNIEDNGFGLAFDEIEKGKSPKILENLASRIEFYSFKNYAILNLYHFLKTKIFNQKLNLVYYRFEKPLLHVLAQMEIAGILVDKIKLKSLSEEFAIVINKLSLEIYELAGEEFNIGSPKQLSEILFEKLSLPAGKKSKSGGFSTNVTILEELDAQGHLIAGKVLEWRHISKLKNTYTDALQNEVNPKTGRIHSTFSNINTSTGRLSSNNPNLQNIPIRTEEGRKIRHAFIANKGHQLVSADYSQIELRVLAHIADIGSLKEAFSQGKDIHTITAAQVFGVSESDVDKETRRKAKAINFGIIYGISAFGLARQLKIGRGEAADYIKAYFQTYPGIQNYMSEYQELGKENGYVQTITGRKCFLSGINSKNPMVKGLAERLAINAPIQGSAADIIKKAMIDLSALLKEKRLQSRLILQVHDELILESPDSEVEEMTQLLKQTMESAIRLDVPIKVDVKVSDHW